MTREQKPEKDERLFIDRIFGKYNGNEKIFHLTGSIFILSRILLEYYIINCFGPSIDIY